MKASLNSLQKGLLLITIVLFITTPLFAAETIQKILLLDANQTYQTIDGFGVNITPAQWQGGHLKPVIDLIVDDLGSTLIRFDCWGRADWLDPKKRTASGKYPQDYLKAVYTGPIFHDAWETFRYFNSKGIEPFFNVSGRIPPELAGADGQTLVDFDGYAEMCVTLLKWAREKEQLKFSLFAPFNETDLGFPEGPKLPAKYSLPAVAAIVKKLKEAGLSDVRLVVLGDSWPHLEKIEPLLNTAEFLPHIYAFSTHTYGNGGDQEAGNDWFLAETPYAKFVKTVHNSPFKSASRWLTEYGDLDQTGEVEFGVAWRSTRRLLKCLADGFTAAQVWDAFDNLHLHDNAWATYGLFHTDTLHWTYSPKRRYYAAKQVYRHVKPGFIRVKIDIPSRDKDDVYALWHEPLKHLRVLAFVSKDKKDFTIVGMSTIEFDTRLKIHLKGVALPEGKSVHYFRTRRHEDYVSVPAINLSGEMLEASIPENSIFTLTTIP